MKRSIATLFATLILFSLAQALQAASSNARVVLGTREVTLTPRAIVVDGSVLVPVDFLKQLDADHVVGTRKATITADGRTAELSLVRRGEGSMVKLDEVAKALDIDCQWDEASSTATLRAKLIEVEFNDGVLTAKTTLPVAVSNTDMWPNPWRLSIDLPGTKRATTEKSIAVDGTDVSQVRIGQFNEDTARIVVDTNSKVPYQVLTVGASREIRVRIGRVVSTAVKPAVGGILPPTRPKNDSSDSEAVTAPGVEPATEEPVPTVSVTGIKSEPDGDAKLKVRISTTGGAKFTSSLFADPLRLVVDVQNSKLDAPLADIPVGHALVSDIRPSQDGLISRVILDMPRYSAFNVGTEGNDVVVSLSMPVAAGGKLSEKRIVIDAGHGGKQPGAIVGDVKEKVLTLKFANAVKTALEQAGATVILTRYGDTYLDLPSRPAVADEHSADLFISIHCNKTEAACLAAGGTETYYHSGQPSSRVLAYAIHERVVSETSMKNRGARPDTKIASIGLSVLRNAHVPAILIETGFMNCPADMKQLCGDEFAGKFAQAVVDGLRDYVEGTPAPEGN